MLVMGTILPREADVPPIGGLGDGDPLGDELAKVIIHHFDDVRPHLPAQVYMGLRAFVQREILRIVEPEPHWHMIWFPVLEYGFHSFYFVHNSSLLSLSLFFQKHI